MIESPPDRYGCLAILGAAAGLLLMFAGLFHATEEGGDLRTWDELRSGRRLFGVGAAVALTAPVLAYGVGRLRGGRRFGSARRPPPMRDRSVDGEPTGPRWP